MRKLIDLDIRRVALVDKAANRRKFLLYKRDDFDKQAFTHNSTPADDEPGWGDVDKTALPLRAHVWERPGTDPDLKSTWSYPHHWISGASDKDDNGIWTEGTMYLHRGGLNAAWAAAQGARTGQTAPAEVIAHLNKHRDALGLNKEEEGMKKEKAKGEGEDQKPIEKENAPEEKPEDEKPEDQTPEGEKPAEEEVAKDEEKPEDEGEEKPADGEGDDETKTVEEVEEEKPADETPAEEEGVAKGLPEEVSKALEAGIKHLNAAVAELSKLMTGEITAEKKEEKKTDSDDTDMEEVVSALTETVKMLGESIVTKDEVEKIVQEVTGKSL